MKEPDQRLRTLTGGGWQRPRPSFSARISLQISGRPDEPSPRTDYTGPPERMIRRCLLASRSAPWRWLRSHLPTWMPGSPAPFIRCQPERRAQRFGGVVLDGSWLRQAVGNASLSPRRGADSTALRHRLISKQFTPPRCAVQEEGGSRSTTGRKYFPELTRAGDVPAPTPLAHLVTKISAQDYIIPVVEARHAAPDPRRVGPQAAQLRARRALAIQQHEYVRASIFKRYPGVLMVFLGRNLGRRYASAGRSAPPAR